jgi:hypothetical protein
MLLFCPLVGRLTPKGPGGLWNLTLLCTLTPLFFPRAFSCVPLDFFLSMLLCFDVKKMRYEKESNEDTILASDFVCCKKYNR